MEGARSKHQRLYSSREKQLVLQDTGVTFMQGMKLQRRREAEEEKPRAFDLELLARYFLQQNVKV